MPKVVQADLAELLLARGAEFAERAGVVMAATVSPDRSRIQRTLLMAAAWAVAAHDKSRTDIEQCANNSAHFRPHRF
jgi:hypothetical protein